MFDLDLLDGFWILPAMLLYWTAAIAVVLLAIRVFSALGETEDDAAQVITTSIEPSRKMKTEA